MKLFEIATKLTCKNFSNYLKNNYLPFKLEKDDVILFLILYLQ